MNEKELQRKAVAEIERCLTAGPTEPRVVHCGSESAWNAALLCALSQHKLHVLARGGDIVVFFDAEGNEIGWRDDGRTGAAQPRWLDREWFRQFVVRELDLPPQTRLGQLRPVVLPPVGWTHEGVLIVPPGLSARDVFRVWVDPDSNRVVQCLRGPASQTEPAPSAEEEPV